MGISGFPYRNRQHRRFRVHCPRPSKRNNIGFLHIAGCNHHNRHRTQKRRRFQCLLLCKTPHIGIHSMFIQKICALSENQYTLLYTILPAFVQYFLNQIHKGHIRKYSRGTVAMSVGNAGFRMQPFIRGAFSPMCVGVIYKRLKKSFSYRRIIVI